MDGEREGGITSGSSGGTGHNVGRSNSFRFNRPRNAFSSSSSSGLNSLGIGGSVGGGVGGVIGEERSCTAALGNSKLSGSSSSLLCKHIKYCCLHQQQQHQQQQQKNLTQNLPPCNQQPQHHLQQHQPLFQQPPPSTHQQQPSIHFVQKSYHSDYTSNNSNSNNCCNNHSTAQGTTAGATCSTTRLGPDGEDNTVSGMLNNGLSNCLANGQLHQHLQHHHQQQQHNHVHNQHHQAVSSSSSSSSSNSQQNKQPTQQQQQQQLQKRHSIILERAFDFGEWTKYFYILFYGLQYKSKIKKLQLQYKILNKTYKHIYIYTIYYCNKKLQ